MSFEGEEDLNIEFGDVVPCDCSEGSYGHIYALVERDCPPRFSCRDSFCFGHSGKSARGGPGHKMVGGLGSRRSAVWIHRSRKGW